MSDELARQTKAQQVAVIELAAARRALAEADTLPDVKRCVDAGETMRVYARKAGLGLEMQNDCAAYTLDAQRKGGQMLAAMELQSGARTPRGNTVLPRLDDFGVSKIQSSRWQRLAELPDEDYVGYKAAAHAKPNGEVTTAGALQIAKRAARDADQRERARRQAQTAPEVAIVELADYRDWLPAQPDCDLLLTDPPYATDVEDVEAFARAWLPMALGKVLPTGRAYVFIGSYPDELRAYLNIPTPEHLILDDVMGWTYRNTIGPQPTHSYKRNWQAILYYRGVDAAALDCPLMVEQFNMHEVAAPTAPTTGRWHSWQKPDVLAERFVRHATAPGDLVLDPFTCTGTFILAAARLGRKALGCEIDPDNLAIAIERGCHA